MCSTLKGRLLSTLDGYPEYIRGYSEYIGGSHGVHWRVFNTLERNCDTVWVAILSKLWVVQYNGGGEREFKSEYIELLTLLDICQCSLDSPHKQYDSPPVF